MAFISGFLGLCSAVSAGSATEIVATNYARQPVLFANPQNGQSVSSTPYDFGMLGTQPVVGRAIFDAPVNGRLLLVLPRSSPRLPQGGSTDKGDAGFLTLVFSGLAAFVDGGAYSGTFTAGSTLGLVYDRDEVVGWTSTAPNSAAGVSVFPQRGQFLAVRTSILTAGVGLTIIRGILQAS